MAAVGTGITITSAASFVWEVIDSPTQGESREAIDVTSHNSTNYRTFIPGDLIDGGELSFSVMLDPDNSPMPLSSAAEEFVVTFPTSLTNGATLTFTGFLTEWSWTAPLEDKMTADITIKIDGNVGEPTWVDAS